MRESRGTGSFVGIMERKTAADFDQELLDLYDEETAAKLAWQRTVDFFNARLRA